MIGHIIYTQLLVCKQLINSIPSLLNYNGSSSLPAPTHVHGLSVAMDNNLSSNGSLSICSVDNNDSLSFKHDGPSDDEDTTEHTLPLDPNLQDVVSRQGGMLFLNDGSLSFSWILTQVSYCRLVIRQLLGGH